MTEVDLTLARNITGPLDGTVRARLIAAVQNPCEQTWDDAHSIILNHGGLTLWQAVLEVEPDFASAGAPVWRAVDGGRPERISGWSRTPSAEAIGQAIGFATH